MDRYSQRRSEFFDAIGDGLAVIPAGRETVRNNDVHHTFRQDSDFHFLTGFPEPESVAVFDPAHDDGYVLFVRPRDREMEAWNGRRAGVEGAIERYGADAAYPLSDLEGVLRERLRGKTTLYYSTGTHQLDDRIQHLLNGARSYQSRAGVPAPDRIFDTSAVLHEMRLRKSPDELAALRTACMVSAEAHAEAMRFAQPGVTEREIQAVLEYVFRSMGAVHDGYPSIVASGPNAVILHYTENERTVEDGDLLLIDAGAEYDYMSADITRTFPVGGSFTAPQRAVYDMVLAAQDAVIAQAQPGTPFSNLHEIAVEVLAEGLVAIGLLPGPVEDAIAFGWYREFYFHGTGHWLGYDVHDAGAYRLDRAGRPLEPGMAFTVEPGVYVAPDRRELELWSVEYDPIELTDLGYLRGTTGAKSETESRREGLEPLKHKVPAEFLGIGIRIEDDVAVTESSIEILSRGVPVAPDEIEALCAEDSRLPRLT